MVPIDQTTVDVVASNAMQLPAGNRPSAQLLERARQITQSRQAPTNASANPQDNQSDFDSVDTPRTATYHSPRDEVQPSSSNVTQGDTTTTATTQTATQQPVDAAITNHVQRQKDMQERRGHDPTPNPFDDMDAAPDPGASSSLQRSSRNTLQRGSPRWRPALCRKANVKGEKNLKHALFSSPHANQKPCA